MTHLQHVPDNLPEKIQHYIDGAFVDSVSGATFDVLDPVSNETYVQAAAGNIREEGRNAFWRLVGESWEARKVEKR